MGVEWIPNIVLLVSYFTREFQKSKKFTWSSNLLTDMEDRLDGSIAGLESEVLNIRQELKALKSNSLCEFSDVFQEYLQCLHDISANSHLTKEELLSALDDNIVRTEQLLEEFKNNKKEDEQ